MELNEQQLNLINSLQAIDSVEEFDFTDTVDELGDDFADELADFEDDDQ